MTAVGFCLCFTSGCLSGALFGGYALFRLSARSVAQESYYEGYEAALERVKQLTEGK
jgi:hypothetical protein